MNLKHPLDEAETRGFKLGMMTGLFIGACAAIVAGASAYAIAAHYSCAARAGELSLDGLRVECALIGGTGILRHKENTHGPQ